MYNQSLDKNKKRIHLNQNEEKRVTTIHSSLEQRVLNPVLNLHRNQNCIGYNFKFFIELFRQIYHRLLINICSKDEQIHFFQHKI